MSYYLIRQIADIPNIAVRTCTEVVEATGSDHLESLTLRDTDNGARREIGGRPVAVHVHRRGAAHRLAGGRGGAGLARVRGRRAGPVVDGERPAGWELDRMPYHLETSVPGVFVAGDVRAESAKRVASAVGEGAMAVMLVHRYLEKR